MTFNPDEKLKDFPCSFNILTASNVSLARLKHVRDNVERDRDFNCSEQERIRDKNLLTWVLFSLGEKTKAVELNKEVLVLTGKRNITALGNSVYISYRRGYKLLSGNDQLKELQILEKDEDFPLMKHTALAEQAYTCSRLGGVHNYKHCMDLFSKCIKFCPDNYLWKFGLALVYRRLTNYNLHCSPQTDMNVRHMTHECVRLLFEVGEKGEDTLKGLAYAQLVCLMHHIRGSKEMFRNLTMRELQDKAEKYGGHNPSVLTQLGKSLKSVDIDDAIDLLQRSVDIYKDSMAYHHLGLCLERKIHLIEQKKYPRSKSNHQPQRARNVSRQLSLEPTTSLQWRPINPDHDHNYESGYYSQLPSFSVNPEEKSNYQSSSKYDNAKQYSEHENTLENLASRFTQSLSLRDNNFSGRQYKRFNSESGHKFYERQNSRQSHRKFQDHTPSNSRSQTESRSSFDNIALKSFISSPEKDLDKENEYVKLAIECYQKAIDLSHEENIPARLNLGNILYRTQQYEDAIAQYSQIVDRSTSDYLVSIISAHEFAGKSFQKLNHMDMAKDNFSKAIILAADLASNHPDYRNCETEVWQSFRNISHDIDTLHSPVERKKKKIEICHLIQRYGDIVDILKTMRSCYEDLDIGTFQKGLNSYLMLGEYENAITFLNIASIKSNLTKLEDWSNEEVIDLKSRTYISASWSRLSLGCPRWERPFQQCFQLKYGLCMGMASAEYEESTKHDVLIVNDETADTEDGPDETSILSQNMQQVLRIIFGLETFRNLMNNVDYCDIKEEIQLQEMRNYGVVLLVLGDHDSEGYNLMLKAAQKLTGPKLLVINLSKSRPVPLILNNLDFIHVKCSSTYMATAATDSSLCTARQYTGSNEARSDVKEKSGTSHIAKGNTTVQDLNDGPLVDTSVDRATLLSSLMKDLNVNCETSKQDIVHTLFEGDVDNIMKLFCFLAGEDFEQQKKFFFSQPKKDI